MNSSRKNLFNSFFSHIYIEKEALNYEVTKDIINLYKNSQLIEVNHYKDVFSRGHQDFAFQKESPKLILAVKKENLIYKGSELCHDFDNKNFYYTSTVMNCVYDCEYCYLQGMYSSANIVIFVNIEDYFEQIKKMLEKAPVYLCISYDTDLLALENILGFCNKWIEFAREHSNLSIEIRTKSSNFSSISNIKPSENIIFSWTLSPNEVIKLYENKTPSYEKRLENIKFAMDSGWKVRLCFDPILYIDNWQEIYKKFIDEIFYKLDGEKIKDISIGIFRVSKDYLKKMRKQREKSILLNFPYETDRNISSYNKELSENMINFVYKELEKYVSNEKIFKLD